MSSSLLGKMAVSRKGEDSNPFFCGEDDDDGYTFGNNRSRNAFDDDDDTLEQLQAQKRASERRQLESTERSLASLVESEDIGNATAEELLRQREQLDNTERNLDSINSMTKNTQRQINSIRSVFGGIKNWFQQKNEPAQPKEVRHSRLKDSMDSQAEQRNLSKSSASNFRTRRLEEEYDNDDDQEDNFKTKSDRNLDMMAAGISRLKGLSLGLGEEIDDSNKQLERLQRKTDKANDEIHGQNQQMRKLLK